MIKLNCISDEGLEAVAVGRPLPTTFQTTGAVGTTFTQGLGILFQAGLPNLTYLEKKVWKEGRWQIGLKPCGSHACLIHVGFKLEGCQELSSDFCYSSSFHHITCGDDVLDRFGEGTLVTVVVVDRRNTVTIMRQTFLSEQMSEALAVEFKRQRSNSVFYNQAVMDFETNKVLHQNTQLSRANCTAWEHSLADA